MKKNLKGLSVFLLIISILLISGGVYLQLEEKPKVETPVEKTESIEEIKQKVSAAFEKTNELNTMQLELITDMEMTVDGALTTNKLNTVVQNDIGNNISYTKSTTTLGETEYIVEVYTVREDGILYSYTYFEEQGWTKSEGKTSDVSLDLDGILKEANDTNMTYKKEGNIETVTIMVNAEELAGAEEIESLKGVTFPYIITIEDNLITSVAGEVETSDFKVVVDAKYTKFNEDMNLSLPEEAKGL